MNDDFDRMLRETLDDLAGEGRPVNLAAQAVRGGNRIIARRRGLAVVMGMAAIVAAVVPFALFSPAAGERQQPIGADSPVGVTRGSATESTEPLVHPTLSFADQLVALPGNWMVAATAAKGETMVWDRIRQRYRLIPYAGATPAPTGNQVAVRHNSGSGSDFGSSSGIGILDLSTDKVQWVLGPPPVTSRLEWSDDGTRLTYASRGQSADTIRAVVVNAATAAVRTLPTSVGCAGAVCTTQWLPGGQDIGINAVGPGSTWQFLVFSVADGRFVRQMSMPGPAASAHSWSPDGKFVVIPGGSNFSVSVAEVTTGQIVTRLGNTDIDPSTMKPSPKGSAGIRLLLPEQFYWATDDRLLCVDGSAITQYSRDGYRLDVYPLPSGMTVAGAYDVNLAPIG